MKQQTAVEWLQQKYDECPESLLLPDDFEQAKEMERKQIVDAHTNGQIFIIENVIGKVFPEYDFSETRQEINKALSGSDNDESAEQYYNETFGSKKEGTD